MKRLLAVLLILAVSQEPASAAWDFRPEQDAFTDTTAYALRLESSAQVLNAAGDSRTPVLQLRCDEDGGRAYWQVDWHNLVAEDVDGTADIEVRFDEGRIRSGGRLAAWLPTSPVAGEQSVYNHAVKALLKRALEANELRLRIRASDGRSLNARFVLAGLDSALENLEGRCKRI